MSYAVNTMKMLKCIMILALLVFPNMGLAQKNIDAQNNGWYMYFGNHKLTNKLSLHTEYQWRRSGFINKRQQSLARLGLDYHLDAQCYGNCGLRFHHHLALWQAARCFSLS